VWQLPYRDKGREGQKRGLADDARGEERCIACKLCEAICPAQETIPWMKSQR
jgi:formate hydrogenlyase subunit 6/NADH:ubiquinone oxidoreductase subunit I